MEEKGLASEILSELKLAMKRQFQVIVALSIAIIAIVAGFLIYLYQYDYSVEATGIYTAVDHSGNIITQDISPEMWEKFLEWTEANNGNNTSGPQS